jgi:hypothetical protein
MSRYRVRVRTADGQEVISDVFEPVGGANPADASDPSSKLEAPEWSNSEFGHGEKASLRVKGKGLDGRKIKFILEHMGKDGWEPYNEATGEMKNGVATAAVPMHHPAVKAGAKLNEASHANVRVHCQVI